MATPNENFATLEAYFRWRTDFEPDPDGYFFLNQYKGPSGWNAHMAAASKAMTELVRDAATNEHVRAQFAQRSIFNTCLIVEINTPFSSAIEIRGDGGVFSDPPVLKQPRLIMLDGIKRAAVGGFFSARDSSGLSSWIYSEIVAGTAIDVILSTDFLPEVLLATLGLLKNAGVPLLWAQSLATPGGALDKLEARIPGTQWSTDARTLTTVQRELGKGVADVRGRYQAELARVAAERVKLASVKTGDGSITPTIPPTSKAWYERGEIVVMGPLGLGLGAYLTKRVKPAQ